MLSVQSVSDKKTDKQTIGIYGEKKAVAFLRRRGYRIRATNYRAAHDELDVVAETPFTLAIVEVKTRCMTPDEESPYGGPAAAVTKEKQRHVIHGAKAYLAAYPTHKRVRFDVIEVFLRQTAEKKPSVLLIRHKKAAFSPK